LKKQSQFPGRQIGVNSFLKGNYGKTVVCGARKNKPNLKGVRSISFIKRKIATAFGLAMTDYMLFCACCGYDPT